MRMRAIVGFVLLVGLASLAVSAPMAERVLKMKTGRCEFKLLDSKGVKPLAAAKLTVSDANDGSVAAEAVASKKGTCSVTLDEGRYVLGIDGVNIAVMESSTASEITECRIVVPETPMLVGAGEDDDDDTNVVAAVVGTGSAGMTWVLVGGAAVLAGGGAVIAENNDWFDSDDDDDAGGGGGGPTGPTSP